MCQNYWLFFLNSNLNLQNLYGEKYSKHLLRLSNFFLRPEKKATIFYDVFLIFNKSKTSFRPRDESHNSRWKKPERKYFSASVVFKYISFTELQIQMGDFHHYALLFDVFHLLVYSIRKSVCFRAVQITFRLKNLILLESRTNAVQIIKKICVKQ